MPYTDAEIVERLRATLADERTKLRRLCPGGVITEIPAADRRTYYQIQYCLDTLHEVVGEHGLPMRGQRGISDFGD